jgi:Na+/proline symporter
MSELSLRCVRVAFLFLMLGIGLGVSFAIDRGLGARLRPLHAELLLWGWGTMLIYGMGYHMVPRFAGRALRRPRLANAQSWLAISGVGLAALGWLLGSAPLGIPRVLPLAGGLLQALAALLFVVLIGEVVWGEPRAALGRVAVRPTLPARRDPES